MNIKLKKILLVDDSEFFLKMMGRTFENNGFECWFASSAAEALLFLDKNPPPDIILSDYEMPEINGIEFRRLLIDNNKLKDIPFVFLTSATDNELMIEGLDLQAIDYVVKDTPVKVVISKINNILNTIDKQRQLTEQEIKKAAQSLNFKSIPVQSPNINGFKIDFWHRAFDDVPGGDFIDFIQVNSRFNFVVLGDVMGKKWSAWFFTFGFLSYVRSAIRFAVLNGEYSVASILQKVNSVICFDNMLKDIMSSLSLLLLDSETGQVTYAGAGDLPLLHYQATNQQITRIKSTGILLGLFESGNYNEQKISLQPHDKLFIFTDGMIDYVGEGGKKSDFDSFETDIKPYMEAGEEFEAIKTKLFMANPASQADDQSIISIYKN